MSRLIYEVTKAFWQNLNEAKTIDAGFRQLSLQKALGGRSDVPLHPGAQRYFKEAGLLK